MGYERIQNTWEHSHTPKMLGCLLYTHNGSNVEKLRWSWVKKYHLNIIKFQRVQFWLNVGAKQPSNCILKCRIWDRIEFFCDSEWRFCDLLRRDWDINTRNICSFVSGKLFPSCSAAGLFWLECYLADWLPLQSHFVFRQPGAWWENTWDAHLLSDWEGKACFL